MTTMLSRVADNLYWMSRHIERAENTARIIDVYQNLILDLPLGIQPESQQARLLQSLEIEIPEDQTPDSFQGLLLELTFSESNQMARGNRKDWRGVASLSVNPSRYRRETVESIRR
jgi:uncharacterized alpha-E superfamily protein